MSVQPDRRSTPRPPTAPVIVGLCMVAFLAALLAHYPTVAVLVFVAAVLAIWRLVANRNSKS